ncbi:MAG: phage minor head protein [Bacillota bacterium]
MDDLWTIAWLQPEDALAYWRERIPMTAETMATIEEEHRGRAFTVAGVTALQYVTAIYEAIDQAIADGLTVEEFSARVAGIGAAKGFTGLAPWHLETVFLNGTTNAYMAGRYRQMVHPATLQRRPIWVYDAVNDQATRPSHAALDGIARRANDPFWQEYYPPNGHRCRCDVLNLTEEEAQRLGYKVDTGIPPGAAAPDPGWATDPIAAFSRWEPDLTRVPAPLRAAHEAGTKTR